MEQRKQHIAALRTRTPNPNTFAPHRGLWTHLRALALSAMLIATLVVGIDPSEGSRKGRYTATDIQIFNPTHSYLQAAVLWTNEDDSFQALLPVNIDPRASNYYTPELSGLIPSTFIGGIEIISDSYQLYATVTHFDKGTGAPAFERGNEHYEARAADNNGLQLEIPTLMRNKMSSSNISILNSVSTRPVTVTLQLHQDSGIVAANYVTTAVGNLLIDLNDILTSTADFSGTGRIFASQPIAAYVSIYDGIGQKGYSAAPVLTPTLAQSPSTLTRNIIPLLQPSDDEQVTRTLYLQNVEYYEANVVIRTRLTALLTTTIPALGQVAYTFPYSKAITEIFVDSDQRVEGVLLIDDANKDAGDQLTGSVAYAALKPVRDQALRQAAADNHCGVAATVYGGYNGWQTALSLVNQANISGTAVITYFPALGASTPPRTPIVVTRFLTPGVSSIPDYTPIANSNAAWSAYIEADVPFVGYATSTHDNLDDGLMAYRIEPAQCVTTPNFLFMPLATAN